jgi:hypothetical protein
VEIGTVLCLATPAHAPFLSRTACGELLRTATADDEEAAFRAQDRAERLVQDARQLAQQMNLPIEVLDAETTIEGGQAVLYHLRRADCDYRPLVSALARLHDFSIVMENLAPELMAGCGRPDCGHGAGGCSSCGSEGGCSSGSCGKKHSAEEVASYLLDRRRQMEARTSLL